MPAAQALEAFVPLAADTLAPLPTTLVALARPAAEALVLADRESRNWVGPGLLGLAVIVVLCVATYLLWRNMNKQLRKVDFDDGKGRDDARQSGRGQGGREQGGAEQGGPSSTS